MVTSGLKCNALENGSHHEISLFGISLVALIIMLFIVCPPPPSTNLTEFLYFYRTSFEGTVSAAITRIWTTWWRIRGCETRAACPERRIVDCKNCRLTGARTMWWAYRGCSIVVSPIRTWPLCRNGNARNRPLLCRLPRLVRMAVAAAA